MLIFSSLKWTPATEEAPLPPSVAGFEPSAPRISVLWCNADRIRVLGGGHTTGFERSGVSCRRTDRVLSDPGMIRMSLSDRVR